MKANLTFSGSEGKTVNRANWIYLIIAVTWVLCCLPAQAIVLDWNSVSWTAGSLSQSFDIDPNNPGNDITITLSGDTSKLQSGYPNINSSQNGGTGNNSLEIFPDFNQTSQSITVTVTFNYTSGVSDVSFTIFDIDTAANGTDFIDQIRSIQGSFGTNSSIVPTITGSANNTVAGSGTGQTITGTSPTSGSSGNGNATIDFGTNTLSSFSFVYGNDSSAPNNPAQQSIGLYDIQFSHKIPEVNTSLAALFICGLAFAGRRLKRCFG